MAVKNILGGKKDEYPWKKEEGMGTELAEYSEAGPFNCAGCWYLQSTEPRKDPKGLCNEPHMIKDPETDKVTTGGKTFAIVDKVHGCCRFIDPVKHSKVNEKFVFAGDLEEESEEHHELSETPEEEALEHTTGEEPDDEPEDEEEEEEDEL